jgi:hypothetical protein
VKVGSEKLPELSVSTGAPVRRAVEADPSLVVPTA